MLGRLLGRWEWARIGREAVELNTRLVYSIMRKSGYTRRQSLGRAAGWIAKGY